MKPLGYFRALEKLLALMRDNKDNMCDLGMSAAGQALEKQLNDAADGVDQAWADLSKTDQLMVYNMAQHLCDNIRPATPQDKEPAKSEIILLH